jgi:leader peptidase (prepilin peptidase) / N-methyltransferase
MPANPLQLVGTLFAALLGLAFGSFLNVVLTRYPAGESLASPRSHCRNCDHTLSWWENIPILSWIILRGRCRNCQTRIGLRYPLVELTIAIFWTAIWLKFSPPLFSDLATALAAEPLAATILKLTGLAILCWLLTALAILDAEYFWLPDWFTLSGVVLGILSKVLIARASTSGHHPFDWLGEVWPAFVETLAPAAIVLVIRLAYWLVRRKEGMGLGDAKLMAMLGAWLGLIGALECFAVAILSATFAALVWLAILVTRRQASQWKSMPLPLGTFLCIAALSEVFYPDWPWTLWTQYFPL